MNKDLARTAAPAFPPEPPRRWSSTDLLKDRPWVEIVHRGQVYRLQRTAADKLILTK